MHIAPRKGDRCFEETGTGLLKGQKKATVSWRTPNRVNIK